MQLSKTRNLEHKAWHLRDGTGISLPQTCYQLRGTEITSRLLRAASPRDANISTPTDSAAERALLIDFPREQSAYLPVYWRNPGACHSPVFGAGCCPNCTFRTLFSPHPAGGRCWAEGHGDLRFAAEQGSGCRRNPGSWEARAPVEIIY